MINKGKTLTINLDNQATSNHFQGQPICHHQLVHFRIIVMHSLLHSI
jgi:hypothetical protein